MNDLHLDAPSKTASVIEWGQLQGLSPQHQTQQHRDAFRRAPSSRQRIAVWRVSLRVALASNQPACNCNQKHAKSFIAFGENRGRQTGSYRAISFLLSIKPNSGLSQNRLLGAAVAMPASRHAHR